MTYLYGIPYYVYKVIHKDSGHFYYGSRYGHAKKGRHPDQDLGIHYFTSSRIVKQMVKDYGSHSFEWHIIQCSLNKDEIYQIEQQLIKTHWKDPYCLNQMCHDPNTLKCHVTHGLTAWTHIHSGKVTMSVNSPGDDYAKGRLTKRGVKCYHNVSGDLGYFLDHPGEGWTLGLPESLISKKVEFGRRHNANRVWWNNGTKAVLQHEAPGPEWKPGRITWKASGASDSRKSAIGLANSGRKYYNNGVETIRRKEHPGPGWVEGKLQSQSTFLKRSLKLRGRKNTLGMKWYNNGLENRLFKDPPPDWVLGRLRKQQPI
jgi:hypothetical protein